MTGHEVHREQDAVAESEARVLLAQKLPELAGAIGGKIGEVKITQIGGDAAGAFGVVTGAVQSIVDMVKSA